MVEYAWYPHPGAQTEFCSAWQDEVLYGGQAGPGKTDCLIMEATRFVSFPEYKGLVVRRTHPRLEEILDRTRQYYPMIGGEFRAGETRWHFPSGATIKLGHCQHSGDEYNYQGQQYQYIGFDEVTEFLPTQYLYLFSRCRSTNPLIPKRIRGATNPGGPGHQFTKDRFQIGLTPPKTTITETYQCPFTGKELTLTRVFIPGRISDNPSLLLNDPNYIAMLFQLPEIERLRLMEGVWDSFEGQAFPELNKEVHGFDFEPPFEWEFFGAFDWGYARPYCYGIFAVDFDGNIYLVDELYGNKVPSRQGEDHNVGLRHNDVEIARAIKELEKPYPRIKYRVSGKDIFSRKPQKGQMSGPSPSEEFSKEGLHFIAADNNRVAGWQQMHHRFALNEDGRPSFYAHETKCPNFWRTMSLMQEDPKVDGDLIEIRAEDHAPEMVRYGLMTRPMKPKPVPLDATGSFQSERKKLIRARALASRFGIGINEAYRRL